MFTNLGERGNADFQTVEFAINRRFSGKWMMLTSFGYTWSTMAHTAAGDAAVGTTTFLYRPFDRLLGDDGIETDTLWNYKIIGRYVLPCDIGFSGSWKVQSGFNYAPHHQRGDAGRRQPHHPRRADRREPLSVGRDPRLAPRQVVRASASSARSRRCSTSST